MTASRPSARPDTKMTKERDLASINRDLAGTGFRALKMPGNSALAPQSRASGKRSERIGQIIRGQLPNLAPCAFLRHPCRVVRRAPFWLCVTGIKKRLLSKVSERSLSSDGSSSLWHLPTFGGRHFWLDVHVDRGHRIQRNVYVNHHRLLDRRDRRLTSGSLDDCLEAARRDGAAVDQRGLPLVVLLHGLNRSRHSMAKLERRIEGLGFETVAPNYPSNYMTLQELGAWLNDFIAGKTEHRRIAFVCFSLGNLVVREALAQTPGWRETKTVAGIVQIGPPNAGADMAKLFDAVPENRFFPGPAGKALHPPVAIPEPPFECPVAVIAGGTGTSFGFNPFLRGDNDGLVRIDETRLSRPHAFHVVRAPHALLTNHKQTWSLVQGHLRDWALRQTKGTSK